MIDFSNYPHLPYPLKQLAREYEEIANDKTESAANRQYFKQQLSLILDGAGDIEELVADAEMRGYSEGLNASQGYNSDAY